MRRCKPHRSSSKMRRYKPGRSKLLLRGHEKYHIFLSFSGKYLRNTVVDHLHRALTKAGFNVFLDKVELKKGNLFWKILKKAIKSSAILIPIFSEGYAGSIYCMREAAAMLRATGLIIPLFYHMDADHVRYPSEKPSPYRKPIRKHKKLSNNRHRPSRKEIREWEDVLWRICEHSGWSITTGLEGQQVEQIVEDLNMTFDRRPLEVAKHPVGLDTTMTALKQKLNLNSGKGVGKVGIWGMVAIGKATAAKALYNLIFGDFQAASFVDCSAKNVGLKELQKQILTDLIKYNREVPNVAMGISLFRERLKGLRVLLILVGVDNEDQLEALVGDWLAPGSRVVITSRDKHILNVAGIPSQCIHEMIGLEKNKALELFTWHASQSPCSSSLIERREKLVEQVADIIVEACEGHPDALAKMGSFLSDKTDDIWIEVCHNIMLNDDIYHRFLTSYEALPDEHKEIFKDIACFFVGKDKDLPILFWKLLPEMPDIVAIALDNLVNKALLKIDDGLFCMHALLQEMGRIFAEKEVKPTRLWMAACVRNLPMNKIFSRVQLNVGNQQRLQVFCTRHLRFLHLKGLRLDLAMLPTELIWVKLEDCHLTIGTKTAVKKPRHSQFKEIIWRWKIMQLKNCTGLNMLFLSSLFSFPNIQLQRLEIEVYKDLFNLPRTVSQLVQLERLSLRGCNLISLPDTIGELPQLEQLDLRGCINRDSLPDTIGNLIQRQPLLFERV